MVSKSKYFEIYVGLFALIITATLVWLGMHLSSNIPKNYKSYYAIFDSVVGLNTKSDVSVAGVVVGVVEKIELNDDGKAKVKIIIDDKVRLFSDAVITVKMKTLLGEKYLDLILGDKRFPLVRNNGMLKAALAVDIDDALFEIYQLTSRVNKTLFTNKQQAKDIVAKIIKILDFFADDLPNLTHVVHKDLQKLFTSDILTKNKKNIVEIVEKMAIIVENLAKITDKVKDIDEVKLRKFLQIDGVRIRLFDNKKIKRKIKDLAKLKNSQE